MLLGIDCLCSFIVEIMVINDGVIIFKFIVFDNVVVKVFVNIFKV